MTVEFTLDKVDFVALNGGPQFKFTKATSFSINCKTQVEIDYLLGETFRRRRIDREGTAGSKTNSISRGR